MPWQAARIALAKALGVPLPRVNDIVRGKRSISPEMAVLLSAYFGTSDGYWINLQGHFDLISILSADYHQQYLAKNPDGYCPDHACGIPSARETGSVARNYSERVLRISNVGSR